MTDVYGPLTGVGYTALGSGDFYGLWRIMVDDPGHAGSLFPNGTPQRYGGLGWVSPYDELTHEGDPAFPGDIKFVRNPIIWLDTLEVEIELHEYTVAIAGITGIAYGLTTGVSITLYVYVP